jgi:mannose-6-phosphate isomerase-like protein (cupin superfamily)
VTLQIRRVVTGHDRNGKAVVRIDEIATNVLSNRPGAQSTVVWATDGWPVDLNREDDISAGVKTTTVPDGTVFRIVQFDPGVAPRNHRTESIDYAVVMAGAIDMELDDGVVVTLRAGDALVQGGTVHNWFNRGTEPCVIAFVLVAARLPDSVKGAFG